MARVTFWLALGTALSKLELDLAMRSIDREKSNSGPFLWRGLVGGLFGGIIGVAVLHSIEAGSIRAAIFYWALLGMIRAVPFTIIGGTIVGALVWAITRRLRTKRLAGAVIGAGIAAILGAIVGAALNYLIINEPGFFWEVFLVRYGVIVGALTGLISGFKDHTK